jgi:hypothetical protein
VGGHKNMTLNKESYFRQKLKTVYKQLQFYSKVIKHVINNFFIYSINNQRIYKNKQQQYNQCPLLLQKVASHIFRLVQFSIKLIPFILRINISFTYTTFLENYFKLKIELEPLDRKVDSGCIVATCFL